MKIAIITQPLRTNYGGILQNYALQTVLKKMGHTPTTLMREEFKKIFYPRYFLTLAKRLILKVIGRYKNPIFYEKKYKRDYPFFTKHTLGFVQHYIRNRVVDYANPRITEDEYDAYIVGSDQVWRPSYNNLDFSFLAFTKDWDVIRCAYAASFGTNEWEYTPNETIKCKQLVSKFNAVSVREASAVHLCNKYLGVEALHVLDPTFLLDKADYEKLIDENDNTLKSQGELFIHILDKSAGKYDIVEKVAKINNWEPFEVNCKVDEHEVSEPLELRIQPPIEQWIRAFRDAQFVITDSFHATAFSIIFNKPFIVYANERRGVARFHSLLALFGLENRIVNNTEDITSSIFQNIDYARVNSIIEQLKINSLSFLRESLNHERTYSVH